MKLNQKFCTSMIVAYASDTLEETFGHNLSYPSVPGGIGLNS